MQTRLRTTGLTVSSLLCALLLGACAEAPEPVGPVQVQSDLGLYEVTLHTAPDPLETGEVTVDLTIRSDGAPVVGADVALEPWMPSMGHGIADVPQVSEGEDGAYQAVFVLNMPGTWELRLDIDGEAGEDELVVAYEVW